jgi:hypothetical protein
MESVISHPSDDNIPDTLRSAPDTRDALDVALACLVRAEFEGDALVTAIAAQTVAAIEARRKAGAR